MSTSKCQPCQDDCKLVHRQGVIESIHNEVSGTRMNASKPTGALLWPDNDEKRAFDKRVPTSAHSLMKCWRFATVLEGLFGKFHSLSV